MIQFLPQIIESKEPSVKPLTCHYKSNVSEYVDSWEDRSVMMREERNNVWRMTTYPIAEIKHQTRWHRHDAGLPIPGANSLSERGVVEGSRESFVWRNVSKIGYAMDAGAPLVKRCPGIAWKKINSHVEGSGGNRLSLSLPLKKHTCLVLFSFSNVPPFPFLKS